VPTQWRSLNYIVVTPNGPADGGDFGPGTPGAKTSGLQEAFNRAHEEVRDVYIVGGGNNARLQKGQPEPRPGPGANPHPRQGAGMDTDGCEAAKLHPPSRPHPGPNLYPQSGRQSPFHLPGVAKLVVERILSRGGAAFFSFGVNAGRIIMRRILRRLFLQRNLYSPTVLAP